VTFSRIPSLEQAETLAMGGFPTFSLAEHVEPNTRHIFQDGPDLLTLESVPKRTDIPLEVSYDVACAMTSSK